MAEPKKKEPSKTKAGESISSLSPDQRGYSATGTYIYTTDETKEKFGDVPYKPPYKPKNDLSPPSTYLESTSSISVEKDRKLTEYCKRNPTSPRCRNTTSHDEENIYQDLGIFSEEVKYMFTPEGRIENQLKEKVKRPIETLYQQNRDNIQLTESPVVRTECKCKDGRVVLGYLDSRTGQKDCSSCNEKLFKSPNLYKNYKTKKKKVFSDKPTKLRDQVGVTTFGDVDMKGCQTQKTSSARIKQIDANKNLNKVISTKQGTGQKVTTGSIPINPNEAFSIYDDCKINIYGI